MDATAEHVEQLLPDANDYNKLEHFRRHKVGPPGSLYVGLDDVILFQAWAPLATQTVLLSIRMLTPFGEVIPCFFTFSVPVAGLATVKKQITNLEGFLLSMSAEIASGSAGSVWVNVVLIRGLGTGDQTQGLNLLQGYPSLTDTLSWPQAPPVKSIDGRALASVFVQGNPAAGAEISITVPLGVQWLLRSIRYVLTTAVAVSNRFSTLQLADGAGHVFAQISGGGAQAASLVFDYTFANGLPVSSNNNVNTNGLPTEARLPGGFVISTLTSGIQAADQYSAIVLELEIFTAQ